MERIIATHVGWENGTATFEVVFPEGTLTGFDRKFSNTEGLKVVIVIPEPLRMYLRTVGWEFNQSEDN